jgi:gamma-glutamyltranspeptidase
MSPTIVFRGDKPFFAVGSPGGTTITMGNLQAILNAVDFGMSAQEAVGAPRFCATSDTCVKSLTESYGTFLLKGGIVAWEAVVNNQEYPSAGCLAK